MDTHETNRNHVIRDLRYLKSYGRVNNNQTICEIAGSALALLKEDCHNCKLECLLQKYDELKEKYDSLLKEQEEVEQKTGHWIWLQYCANEGVYCSECHTKMFDYYPMKKKLSQFCGHCGAKMDGKLKEPTQTNAKNDALDVR